MISEELKLLASDRAVEKVFAHADFGSRENRNVIKFALLKVASGYANGYTAQCIIERLGLCENDKELTINGKEYLWLSFENGYS
tara:strand:- start:741 stop:992 length:252 start_codon:yes stop_codon:yes gene_type:complete